ncbi:MAG: alpha/beta fold hydrolase [Acidimicrobiia bacterium]
MASRVRYAVSDGLRIAYQIVGAGPGDLVFMPGFVSHVELAWEDPHLSHFFRRLASFRRLIVFDKRGTGLSDPITTRYTQSQRVDDIRAVMDAAGSEHATIFGVSEGGAMAILFAATYPDRVDSLVLHSTVPRVLYDDHYTWGWTPRRLQAFLDGVVELWGTGEGAEYANPTLAGDTRYREWFARYTRNAASPSQVVELMGVNAELDIRSELRHVTAPSLLTHRSDESWVSVEHARYLARTLPAARLVEFPGVDHWPWIGNADEILDVIEEFVTGRRPRRRARPNAIGIDALSPRQRQVLRRSIEGQTAAEIAGSLGVGVRTIETHLAHGYAKLGVRSRVELVRRYRDAAV